MKRVIWFLLVLGSVWGRGRTWAASLGGGDDWVESSSSAWPMYQPYDPLLPHQRTVYYEYMRGCYERYSMALCDRNERERLDYNRNQPPQQTNFTSAGYAKVAAPTQVYQILHDYWKQFHASHVHPEDWDPGNVYVNHWQAPTTLVPLDRLPDHHRNILLTQLRAVLESWSQTRLVPVSLYGMRVYHRGAILAPHVDRLPLVISAIVPVARRGADAADWPLQLVGHDGHARNITLEPGDMLLYESHSVIHGRPYALQGDYYASVFLHFEPLDYTDQWEQRRREQAASPRRSPKELFEAALAQVNYGSKLVTQTIQSALPDYIREGSEEAKRWRQEFVFFRDDKRQDRNPPTKSKVRGVTPAHVKAANGSVEDMKKIYETDPESILKADSNGWKPIHEAARGGNTDVVAFLLRKGADVNERTNHGKGGNALWWAKQTLEGDHPIIRLLERNGGIAIGPNE